MKENNRIVSDYKPEDVVKTVTYYSPHKGQGFDLPARDENGNLIAAKDGRGVEIYRKGKKIFQEIYTEFDHMIEIRTKNTELLCFKRVDFVKVNGKEVPVNPDLYEALEKLSDDPSTKIEREESYKNRVNPQAYAIEKELKETKAELARLKKGKAENTPTIKSMLEEQEKLQKEFESKGNTPKVK